MEKSSANLTSRVRPAAVAGRFYPGPTADLRRMIEGFLDHVEPGAAPAPKAVIAPHAGYLCSGPIAASAYARLASAREVIRRIVLIGPSHYDSFAGLAASGAEAFATPLGLVPVDVDVIRQISSLRQVRVLEHAHAREHSLEVHLPFLQVVLKEFRIVPLLAGDATDEEVTEVIDALWGGDETRFVISSDLSHYHDYAGAQRLDAFTGRAIEQLRPQDITEELACGRIPVRGLLCAARQRGLKVRTVDLRNSGDTTGLRDKVVGYGAFVFQER